MANKKSKVSDKEAEENLRRNPVNAFCCHSCGNKETLSFPEFKKHLKEVHNVNPEGMKGNRQMLMHMDGSYWFSSTYKWTLENGVEFTQHVEMARAKNDMMRY